LGSWLTRARLEEDRPTFAEILSVLDDVIVEALIADNTARRFWREKCGDKVKLPWKDFMTAFASTSHPAHALRPPIYEQILTPTRSRIAYVHEKQRPFLPLTPEAELKLACLKQLVGTAFSLTRSSTQVPCQFTDTTSTNMCVPP
jgi:hypothetical protein